MKDHGLRCLFATLIMACLLACGMASAETYTSLVERYGEGVAACTYCNGEATVTSDEDCHYVVCQNEECSYYNARMISSHCGSCVDSSVCGVCGAAYSGSYTTCQYAGMPYEWYSNWYHYQYCALCGDNYGLGYHSTDCLSDACDDCGTAVTEYFKISHNSNGIYLTDETQHWQTCLDCGEPCDVSAHYGSCETATCSACGTVYTDKSNMYHSYDYSTYVPCPDNENYHGYACTVDDCGYVSQSSSHSAPCTALGVCEGCGVEYTGDNITHNYDYSAYVPCPDNADYHGYACTDCDTVSQQSEHWGDCEDMLCNSCGAECSADRVSHDYDYDTYVPCPDNENYHGYACTGCGIVSKSSSHSVSCMNPGVCVDCGIEYTGSSVTHNYDYSAGMVVLPSDEDHHGYVCVDCGYEDDYGEHYASCAAPGVCNRCGVEYTGSNQSHSYDYSTCVPCPDNTAYHGYVCKNCGYVSQNNSHSASCINPGVCKDCGAEYTGSRVSHTIDWSQQYTDERYHWYLCADCGEETNKSEHYADCMDPTTCNNCGAEDVTMAYLNHSYEYGDYQSDKSYHWHICDDCGETISRIRHRAYCTDPTTCSNCGAEDIVPEYINHSYDYDNQKSDENYHWYICEDCGEVVSKNKHYANCADPTTCSNCGAEDIVPNYINHSYDYDNPESDENYHWYICEDCGEVVDKYQHYASCADPTTCSRCGTEDIVPNYINHSYDYDNPESDENYHWNICEDCGEVVYKERHYASCANPTTCSRCGTACIPNYLNHSYTYNDWQSDGNFHWHVCEDCGSVVDRNGHAASCVTPGVCEDCGAEYTGSGVSHNYDWDDKYCDENYHWNICLDCGEVVNKERHYASCLEPNICEDCGYEGENIPGGHSYYVGDFKYDETFHWNYCRDCGNERISKEMHSKLCTGEDVCSECGAAYSGANIGHIPNEVYYGDGYEHWQLCALCGEETQRSSHNESCRDPGFCETCGAEYTAWYEDSKHNYSLNYESSIAGHWRICGDCGELNDWDTHYARCGNPGVCDACGYELEGMSTTHYVEVGAAIDATTHYVQCEDCDMVFEEEHSVYCADPTATCYRCGMSGVETDDVEHLGEDGAQWQGDENGHWYACSVCEQNTVTYSHEIDCAKPGVCFVCGYETENGDTWHYTSSRFTTDEGYHWNACSVCGEALYRYEHYDYYAPVGYCDYCGYQMGDVELPPTIYSDDLTLYLTEQGYGDVFTFWAKNPESEGELSAASSDAGVAAIEQIAVDGTLVCYRVTGYKAGSAVMTITAPNGQSSTVTVTVADAQNEIELPSAAKSIGEEAFAGAGIEFLYIPSSVTAIRERAFADCAQLKVIYIPASVETIGEDVFTGCGDNFWICTPAGSAAAAYAEENGIMCIEE